MNNLKAVVIGMGVIGLPMPLLAASVQNNFQALITIQNTCAITTAPTNLNFGAQGVLVANVDTTSTIKATCTTGTTTSCAMRSNGSMVKVFWPRFHVDIMSSPW